MAAPQQSFDPELLVGERLMPPTVRHLVALGTLPFEPTETASKEAVFVSSLSDEQTTQIDPAEVTPSVASTDETISTPDKKSVLDMTYRVMEIARAKRALMVSEAKVETTSRRLRWAWAKQPYKYKLGEQGAHKIALPLYAARYTGYIMLLKPLESRRRRAIDGLEAAHVRFLDATAAVSHLSPGTLR